MLRSICRLGHQLFICVPTAGCSVITVAAKLPPTRLLIRLFDTLSKSLRSVGCNIVVNDNQLS